MGGQILRELDAVEGHTLFGAVAVGGPLHATLCWRSPKGSPGRSPPGSSTATSSRPTSCSREPGRASR